jgi:hypothetical protein
LDLGEWLGDIDGSRVDIDIVLRRAGKGSGPPGRS